MAASNRSLNNSNLVELFFPAAAYNNLPRIDGCKLEPFKHRAAHSALLDLIIANGLSELFSIHLIHKHFDCPDGQVMVYEKVKGGKTSDFIIMTPRDPAKTEGLRGLYFIATPHNNMVAYEYTTEPGKDLSAYADFVAEFAAMANLFGVDHIFCLGAEGITSLDNPTAEFEIGALSSTVVVETDALDGFNNMRYLETGWKPIEQGPSQNSSLSSAGTITKQSVAYTGETGGKLLPEIPGVALSRCIVDRAGRHNTHGFYGGGPMADSGIPFEKTVWQQPHEPMYTHKHQRQQKPVTYTGEAGHMLLPEAPGIALNRCIFDRAGRHNTHGILNGEPVVESRQSMPGMSHKRGDGEVEIKPRTVIGGIEQMYESRIHDVINRAVAAIRLGNATTQEML